MRDIYRSGQFDEVIDAILRNADTVRHIYKKVSKSERAKHWYPFQVICEQCGRIGTTEVSDYDGREVTYTCRSDLVKWAKGCGYQGKMSPFSGKGKLPWKLEWVAKWKFFGITIEGAGKDHTTKGGSRDVAGHCLREIFHQEPPLNVPYEFFLVGGAKMSSSRGVGESARDMADFLPPELLRFLMVRPHPKKPINFSADEEYIIKLFNEFDRYREQTYHNPSVSEEVKQTYLLSEVAPEGDYFNANIQLLQALVQMPHIDPIEEINFRKGSSLTPVDLKHLQRRIESVKYWLDHYAQEQEKLQLQLTLPAKAQELTALQRAFLHLLAKALPTTPWVDDELQSKIFEVARLTPIKQAIAFQAIYRILFNRDSGPKAGNLFMFLNRDFLIQRFQELSYSQEEFFKESSISPQQLEIWLKEHETMITTVRAVPSFSLEESGYGGVIEFLVTLADHKTYLQRVLFAQAVEGERYLEELSGQIEIIV
jgi:lysyl-tRNA synthetase class 1